MADRRTRHMLLPPEQVHPDELFPEWGHDVDRRIAASESRIKFWILSGVITNLLVAVGAAIPLVFYMGQISRDIAAAVASQEKTAISQAATDNWMRDRMVWEARVESILEGKGLTIRYDSKRQLPEESREQRR